jgi:hypothetical protein
LHPEKLSPATRGSPLSKRDGIPEPEEEEEAEEDRREMTRRGLTHVLITGRGGGRRMSFSNMFVQTKWPPD